MTKEPINQPQSKLCKFFQQNLSPLALPMPTGGKSTLTEYIDENSKLLSALGLFLGLSVFANNLSDKVLARMLSFLLFTLGILVFCELLRNFRAFNWYGSIYWFREVLTLSMFVFIYFYAKTYYPFLLAYLFMAAFLFVLLIAFVMVQATIRWVFRISWFRGLNPRTREFFIPVFGGLSLMAICELVLLHSGH